MATLRLKSVYKTYVMKRFPRVTASCDVRWFTEIKLDHFSLQIYHEPAALLVLSGDEMNVFISKYHESGYSQPTAPETISVSSQ